MNEPRIVLALGNRLVISVIKLKKDEMHADILCVTVQNEN